MRNEERGAGGYGGIEGVMGRLKEMKAHTKLERV